MSSTSWEDPFHVASVLYGMKMSEQPRSMNRARINALFNGNPPYTEQEARENRVSVNVNFLEATKIAQDARRQFYNAFIRPANYFTVKLDGGPPEKRMEWGNTITRQINRIMKESLPYTQILQQKFAQMVLHGIGPVFWPKRKSWMPEFIGIDEILVPSNTRQSLDNLDYFAIHRRYSAGELYRMTQGEAVDEGWNKSLVKQVIERMQKQIGAPGYIPQPQFYEYERFEEDYKSNSGYWASDSVPTTAVWDFYYCEKDDKYENGEGWCRKVLLDSDTEAADGRSPEFLFDPKDRIYASEREHLLHINFADGCNVAPFRYHSVRGVGFMEYAVCHLQNRLRGKLNEATFESCVQLFRDESNGESERLERIDLTNFGLLPNGVSFVNAADRFRVDFPLVQGALAMNRQLMSENSVAFTRDINDGTDKEMTAAETMARVNSASSMMGSILNLAYAYEVHQCREIARRFCLDVKNDTRPDRDIVKFQLRCLDEGVPQEALNSNHWIVDIERVIGAGNKMLELAQTQELKVMAQEGLFDPEGAKIAYHLRAEALVDDPYLADKLVPLNNDQTPSEAMSVATLAWASLIDGKPVVIARGMNEQDYVETLLQLLNMEIDAIEQSQEVPEQRRIMGLANVIQHITNHVAIIAQNDKMGPQVKMYGDQLKKASNYVRAYAQRAQERAQASGAQMDPAMQAKIQSMIIEAEAKAEISRNLAAQKQAQKDAGFVRDQARRDAKVQAEIATKDLTTSADIIRTNAEAQHTVQRDNVIALTDVERENAIAAAQTTNGQPPQE